MTDPHFTLSYRLGRRLGHYRLVRWITAALALPFVLAGNVLRASARRLGQYRLVQSITATMPVVLVGSVLAVLAIGGLLLLVVGVNLVMDMNYAPLWLRTYSACADAQP